MYKQDIGINSGVIWRLLSDKGTLSIREIGEFTHYHEMFLFLALGWLAREDKIRFYEKEGVLYVELKDDAPGWYF
ncbi:MAG: winged helix-turn-helix domain-containing protein [Dysgonamonadaceae bacterium]|jgi:hypothetical protein|nr:winged helix-turn-helix domain-containing protein [Dysgonamonadaceae bacterium]